MKSIRLQLPITYAAIALLAALSLGALMLWRLNDYYTQQELQTMRTSAQAIQMELQTLDLSALPVDLLQAQAKSFAYFARSRVQIYGTGGNLLVDSGEIDWTQDVIRFAALPSKMQAQGGMIFIESGTAGPDTLGTGVSRPALKVVTGGSPSAMVEGVPPLGGKTVVDKVQSDTLPIFTVAFNAGLAGVEETSGGRSEQSVVLPLIDRSGASGGRLVVSGGPAYGRQIVTSVAQAWALAGVLAVLLAAAAGWWASKRITRPLMALEEVTGRMAAGDLGARAGELAGREFSALGHSFNDMAAQIEATIQTLRRFAADAAHELKTPLTALRTDLELAGGASDPARLAELLARARSQVLELDHLTAGLLDLSRLEARSTTLEREELDLADLARQLSERYAARAEQACQEFVVNIPGQPVRVCANRPQVALAVGNLLENAMKFTPAGGTIRLALVTEPGWARICVEDTGMGIPEADLPLLFERFHRGRNAAEYPGSGLGLAIVRAVAEAHGGKASGENQPGGGARFTLELPA